ncbi:MAG: HAD-IA family hydrolase [Actinobacteria bacterium]|nr:HAD-IA family hydrolase [Actinomycetota bacterium]
MTRFTCKAILFDLDGVLADSTAVVDRVWRVWAEERGFDGDAIMKVAHGRPSAEIIRDFAPDLSVESEVELLEHREAEDLSGLVGIPGAAELVRSLPPASWAVVTSGTSTVAGPRLAAVGIPAPCVLITANDILKGKPNPEGYLAAASRLGAPAGTCIVIEDSPAGLAAARAAGMRTIGVTTTFPLESLAPVDALVSSLEAVCLENVGEGTGGGLPVLELCVGPSG